MKKQGLQRRNRKNERGSVMIVGALGMLSLLLAVGLGVDISHLYLAKNELQNAADASALAGASALNTTPTGITKAADRATKTMNNYEFNKTGIIFSRTDVRFGRNLSDFDNGTDMSEAGAMAVASTIKFVKVKTPSSPVRMSFVGFVIGYNRNLDAEAIAGMSAPLNVFMGYLPLFPVTDDANTFLQPGSLYTIRGAPQNSISPGNYQILAIDGSGGADDRIDLASAVSNPVGPGGYVDTKPGVTAGAVRQGINTRFDDYASGMDPADFPPDSNIKEGITYQEYLNGSPSQAPSHPGVDGRRVVLLPIMTESQVNSGRTTVQIDHFGAFFLRSKVSGGNGGDIEAEYIGIAVNVGGGFYDPSAPPNPGPPIVKPVLYR